MGESRGIEMGLNGHRRKAEIFAVAVRKVESLNLLGIGFGKLLYVPVPPCDPQQGCVVHGTMDATKRGNP